MPLGTPISNFLLLPALVWVLPLLSDTMGMLHRISLRRPGGATTPGQLSRLLFLVPAHNESLLIGTCVRSLLAQQQEWASIDAWVVADNCTDDTARIAAAAGARVLERHDPGRPGKPAAIAFALASLPLDGVDAVVIVDADTVVDAGFADALTESGPLCECAVQAWFGVANPGETWLTRLASLFVDVRYAGQFALKRDTGLNVPLTGNGMCLGTGLLARLGWEGETLTEDTELYARYTAAGVPIGFAEGAVLRAQEARDLSQTATQRRRWQAGRWQVLLRYTGPILTSRQIGMRQKLDAMAELCFPGPVTHAAVGLGLGVPLVAFGNGVMRLAGGMFLCSLMPTIGWTVWALIRRPDRGRLLLDLLRLPPYAIWRLTAGVAAIIGVGGRRWERSPRHDQQTPDEN